MVDSASCDIIDLTADDEEVRLSSRHATETEPASRQGFSQPHPVQCKADSGQPAALPDQDMPHQQGSLSGQAKTSAQQAGVLLQPVPALPDQATLPRGEGIMQVDGGQPPLPLGDDVFGGEAALPLKEGVMGVDGGKPLLTPLAPGGGCHGGLVYLLCLWHGSSSTSWLLIEPS